MQPAAPPPVPASSLHDLIERLRRFRAAAVPPGHGWGRGVDGAYLEELVHWWASEYDWPSQEERIRALPWAIAGARRPVRVVHQRAGAASTVVLLHGWPDSILRFERVLRP